MLLLFSNSMRLQLRLKPFVDRGGAGRVCAPFISSYMLFYHVHFCMRSLLFAVLLLSWYGWDNNRNKHNNTEQKTYKIQ